MSLQTTYTGIFNYLQTSFNTSLPTTQQMQEWQFGDGNAVNGNYPLCRVIFANGEIVDQTASYFVTGEDMFVYFFFNTLSQSDMLGFVDSFLNWWYPQNQTFAQPSIIKSEFIDYAIGKDPSGSLTNNSNALLVAGFKFNLECQQNVY